MGKLVDELLEYLSNASSEQLAKDWDELSEFNEVGPEVVEFVEQWREVNWIYDLTPEVTILNKYENPEFTLDFFYLVA